MKDFLEFLKTVLDRWQLWLWLAVLTIAGVVADNIFGFGLTLLKDYGLIAFITFLALFLQSQAIHDRITAWIKGWLASRESKRLINRHLAYVLATPCKEHVILVAYVEKISARLQEKYELENILQPIFFYSDGGPTPVVQFMVEQGFAERDTSSGKPFIHMWAYNAFRKALSSPESNECKITRERLYKYGERFVSATNWSTTFDHDLHKEAMRKLEGEA